MSKVSGWVLLAIGGAILLAGIAILGWQGGWWLNAAATNRSAQIAQDNYGSQSTFTLELHSQIGQIAQLTSEIHAPGVSPAEQTALRGQRTAMTSYACALGGKILPSNRPTDEAAWYKTNCL